MGMAFQITDEDIILAGRQHFGLEWSHEEAEELMDSLDLEMIEETALNGGCEMDEQTDAAIDEIALQLFRSEPLTPLPSSFLSKLKVGE